MTLSHVGKPFYVAAERFAAISAFADANGVARKDVRPITQANSVQAVPHGIEIWVVDEIGSGIAQEISFLVECRGASVRYADCFDVIGQRDA